MASSSSSSSCPIKHQVFLSFRGEDTRLNFTSHLLKALKDTGMNVFFDEDTLEKGEQLSAALSQAIAASNLSIIVLSEDYASSKSCLAELSDIVDRKRTQEHILLPIFYHIDPSHVRNIDGSFKTSFDYHESNGLNQVQRWKSAFAEVGKLKGWHIGGKFDRSETEYIKDVVEYVIKKLNSKSISVSEVLVGIEDQKKTILRLIHEQEHIRVIGLWGMGGIGKTTLAEVVYNEISPNFESRCFLQNVREKIEKKGKESLRNELVSKLLNSETCIDTPSIGSDFTQQRLKNKRVFVVLDDVVHSDQINYFGVKHFGDGSKVIVTSRDRQVLENGGADKIHKVEMLNDDDSLQIFSTFAFKLLNPVAGFRDLSNMFVKYVRGSPLALKVFGSQLYKKSIKDWESEMDKLKEYGQPEISKILKRSFDGLDEQEKDIFLDIACFFKGESKKEVEEALSCLYKGAVSKINNLVDKGLLDITPFEEISMHDLLEEMGKDIVRQESKGPGKRSRLWSPDDVHHVLRYNTGTDSIEGIKLDMSENHDELRLCPTVFQNMLKLKFIYFSGFKKLLADPDQVDIVFLPNELRYLRWNYYPFKSFSSSFNPKNIVALILPGGDMEELWNEDHHQGLGNLRKIDVSDCKNLRKIPNLLGAINLKLLDCRWCNNLVELPCLNHLASLERLELSGCNSLVELPCLDHLTSLERLDLSGCNNLSKIPNLLGALNLKLLDCRWCNSLVELPCLDHLVSLERLDLSGCNNLRNIPNLIGAINLKFLDCTWCNSLVELCCLNHLASLERLDLSGCNNLRKIPNLLGAINLKLLDCKWCSSLVELPCLSHLTFLERLDLSGCNSLVELPYLNHLVSLEMLNLSGCNNLRKIPTLSGAINLKFLDCRWCNSLVELPCLNDLASLENIDLSGCNNLREIPNLSEAINLKLLDCRWCNSLVELPCLNHLASLERLDLSGCNSLRKIPNLLGAINLKFLDYRWCNSLVELPCLNHLKSLETFPN